MIGRTTAVAVAGLTLSALPACGQDERAGGEAPEAERVARALGVQASEGWRTDFSRITVPLEEIASGGPPKDGIPAIDDPRFVSPEAADRWLGPTEPVIVVEHDGVVKVYPFQILIWHEIVNDVVGGRPLVITFCPLCNTALVFERRVGERVLDFGTTGRLRYSDLIMYDRQTETWWQQASGQAIVGEQVGAELEFFPARTFSWERARSLHPRALVLSRETGYRRDYGASPYAGYDSQKGPIGPFFNAPVDRRFQAMERVVALELGDGWAAPFSELSEVGVVNAGFSGAEFVVFWEPGASSALDESRIAESRDIGQTAVYDRRLGDRILTFERHGFSFRDRETGTSWDLAGRAIEGPLDGERLDPIPYGNHFWFAWAVFKPDTEVWRRP
jgi:hypothetical protein